MMSNARCWKQQLAALGIVTSLLSGCATVSSEDGRLATCPSVIEYGREFRARAAEELVSLSEKSSFTDLQSN